jgi:hypothetical protein
VGNKKDLGEILEGCARLFHAQGQFERAVGVFSAAAALRETIGSPQPPVERAANDQMLMDVRRALGEDAFLAARAAGASLPLDEAIAWAMGIA